MSKKLKKYAVVFKEGLVLELKLTEVWAKSKCDAVMSVVNSTPWLHTVVSVERIKDEVES